MTVTGALLRLLAIVVFATALPCRGEDIIGGRWEGTTQIPDDELNKPGTIEKGDDYTVRYVFADPYFLLSDLMAGSTAITAFTGLAKIASAATAPPRDPLAGPGTTVSAVATMPGNASSCCALRAPRGTCGSSMSRRSSRSTSSRT